MHVHLNVHAHTGEHTKTPTAPHPKLAIILNPSPA